MIHQLDANVTTPQLSDALDMIGRRAQTMEAAIVPLALGSRAVGRAATVQFAPVDHDVDEPYDAAIAFIDGLSVGAVADDLFGGSTRSGFWGELFLRRGDRARRHGRGVRRIRTRQRQGSRDGFPRVRRGNAAD